MSKKTLIITSTILVLFLIFLIGYYFLTKNNSQIPTQTPSKFNFYPFGSGQPTGTTTNNNGSGQRPPDQNNFNQKLRKLSSEPVAGAGTLDVKAGTVVHYTERATGHIFEIELFSPKQGRISNTTIPLVYDALWGNQNKSFVARFLEEDNQTVNTFSFSLKEKPASITSTTSTSSGQTSSPQAENAITAVALPSNIGDVSVFDNNVFYLKQETDSSQGFVSNFDNKKTKQVWNSSIRELSSQFLNAKTVALTTKPAQNTLGFLYFVDTGTGNVKKILGDIYGLSTLSNSDGTNILYLIQTDNVFLYSYDLKNKVSKIITPLTFPEKCFWSKIDKNIIYCAVPKERLSGDSLTLWYQGLLSFTDDIWKYNIKNNTAAIIENLSDESGENIDVVKPILSQNERYLLFINKRDNSLWSLDLTK